MTRAMPVCVILVALGLLAGASSRAQQPAAPAASAPLLGDHLLVTWYGNPRSTRMGVLGLKPAPDRAESLRKQAQEYAAVSRKRVLMAYHLVAVIAQPEPGRDGRYRRRETRETIQSMLDEARTHGFRLILDIQPGRSTVADEVRALEPFLTQPDVDLALDPEFAMPEGVVPGTKIGTMRAEDVNAATDALDALIRRHSLPRKMLMVHQFTHNMLPDKAAIRTSPVIDHVLDMDGFGSPSLKRSTWRFVMKQPLPFAGFKLFYKQDTELMTPAQVMALTPTPSVIVYQ